MEALCQVPVLRIPDINQSLFLYVHELYVYMMAILAQANEEINRTILYNLGKLDEVPQVWFHRGGYHNCVEIVQMLKDQRQLKGEPLCSGFLCSNTW